MKRITTALVTERDMETLPRAERTERLDLGEYDDPDHVSAQAEQEPLPKPAHIAWCMANPDSTQRAMYEIFRIGWPRIKAAKTFAAEILRELGGMGLEICNTATLQRAEAAKTRNG